MESAYGRVEKAQLEELQSLERMLALREAQMAVARAALSLRVAELLDFNRAPVHCEIDTATGEIRPRGGR